jgi:hypothetical protein
VLCAQTLNIVERRWRNFLPSYVISLLMDETGVKNYEELSDDYHQRPVSVHDFGVGGGSSGVPTLRSGSHDWEDRQRLLYHGSHDSDTRSQCSQRSGYSSIGGGGDHPLSSTRSVGSVGSQGSGDYRASGEGLPLHVGHVHFGHALSAAHLLSGDATHQFLPSMYQASVEAPKSDAATVCSASVLEDIEVESHVSESHLYVETDGQNTLQAPSSSVKRGSLPGLRRSNSAEGNRLVDFADRSQVAMAPVQSHDGRDASEEGGTNKAFSTVESMSTGTSVTGNMDDDTDMASINNTSATGIAVMGPPLSRSWLLQQHGTSSPRPGSVKSFESNTGSDVVAHVGSDCGGSFTDCQEDSLMAATSDSCDGTVLTDAPIANEEKKQQPHPLLCSQPDSKNGRISPGGTIYRGRGVRRYKGRFMHLPLKRFHNNGVHLSCVDEHSDDRANLETGHTVAHYDDRWQARGYSAVEDDYQRGDHSYYGQPARRRNSRSRSRSRSPNSSPVASTGSQAGQTNGYHCRGGKNWQRDSKVGRGYVIEPLPQHGRKFLPPSSLETEAMVKLRVDEEDERSGR